MGGVADLKQGARYWNAFAVSAIEAGYGKARARFSWSVFNLSDPAHEKLQAAFHKFRRTMSGIIDADQRESTMGKRTYVYTLNLADLDYVPEGGREGSAI